MNETRRVWHVRLFDTQKEKFCYHDIITSKSREEVIKDEREFYKDSCIQLVSVTLSPNQNW